ncbi:MAG: hypothetical protein IPJ20_20820 [Flammeovirgaceae bacterium]|nr:hypothetical protein [Flammeovirgaceae bacterium]
MSLLKYLQRLKRMDDLIRRKATGNAQEFAKKLGISQSHLFLELRELKELGAPVEYSNEKKCYFYSTECKLILDFVKDGERLKGGENISWIFNHSYNIEVANCTLQQHGLES